MNPLNPTRQLMDFFELGPEMRDYFPTRGSYAAHQKSFEKHPSISAASDESGTENLLRTTKFSMKQMTSLKDVGKFAGEIVAYKTNSYYLTSQKSYSIGSDDSIKFAIINFSSSDCGSGERGYGIKRLVGARDFFGNYMLTDSVFNDTLEMRKINKEEAEKIQQAITSSKARFEHITDKEEVLCLLRRSTF